MKVKTLKKKTKFNSALSHYLIPHVSIVLIAISSHAQSQTPDTSVKRFVEITPSLSISETWTDNVRAGSAQSDYITEISPGLLLTSETGFLKGYFDYKANNISYVRNKSSNKLQSALNANLQIEVVENFLFIDAGGQISQQSISILGPSSPVNSLINENRAEVSSYKISPSIKGQFLGFANYEGRISRSINTSLRSNIDQRDLSFKLSGNTLIQGLGWLFDSNRQTIDFGSGRSTEADLFLVGFAYEVTPQISINASSGFDRNNYSSSEKEKDSSSRVGIDWRQSETTTLSAAIDQRSFGQSHRFNFNHRTGRTAWTLSSIKNVATEPNQSAVRSSGSLYDILLYQFESLEPNLALRSQLVKAYLQANNLNPDVKILTPFLTSAQSISDRQELIFSLLGIRSTFTFIASRARSQRLDSLSSAVDDLSSGNSINQQGLSMNLSHRLSPELNVSIFNSKQIISSNNNSPVETINLFSINLSKNISRNSSFSLGVRNILFDRAVEKSRETAITANFNLLF